MVTVTVAAILMAIAVPAFQRFVQNDRQWTQSTTLVMALNAARSEAIKQDVPNGVQVCASSNNLTCNSTNWASGWVVLNTANPGTPIATAAALPTGTTTTEAAGQSIITFLSDGTAQSAAAFTMCDVRGPTQAVYVQVIKYGSITTTTGKKPSGAALTCP